MASSKSSPPTGKPWFFFQLVESWEYRHGALKECDFYVVAARSSGEAEQFARTRLKPQYVRARSDSWRVPDHLIDRLHAQWPGFISTDELRSIGQMLQESADGVKGIYLLGGDRPLKFGVHLDPGEQPPRPLQQWEIDCQARWKRIKPYAIGLLLATAGTLMIWFNLSSE